MNRKKSFDLFDFRILREFYKMSEKENMTSWEMMKRICPNGGDRENDLVKRRIKNMANNYGFFYISNKPETYTLIKDHPLILKIKKLDKQISEIIFLLEPKNNF